MLISSDDLYLARFYTEWETERNITSFLTSSPIDWDANAYFDGAKFNFNMCAPNRSYLPGTTPDWRIK